MPKAPAVPVRQMAALKRAERKAGTWLPDDHERPRTRGDCASMPRPCPFVGCRYHLFLAVTQTGSIQLPHGDDVSVLKKMPQTCALDVADEGPMELRQVARVLDLTIEGTLLVANSAYARLAETRVVRENSAGKVLGKRRVVQNGRGKWREAKRLAEAIGAENK